MSTKELISHFRKEIKATPDGANQKLFAKVIKDPTVATRRKRPDGEVEVSLPDDHGRR